MGETNRYKIRRIKNHLVGLLELFKYCSKKEKNRVAVALLV